MKALRNYLLVATALLSGVAALVIVLAKATVQLDFAPIATLALIAICLSCYSAAMDLIEKEPTP